MGKSKNVQTKVMHLHQIMTGDGIEELWEFPIDVSEEEIKDAWKEYYNSEYESFEEYIDEYNPQLGGIRKFVNEIYI